MPLSFSQIVVSLNLKNWSYIHAFITQTDGKIYREANTGLGKSDMIINIDNREYLIETKIYYDLFDFVRRDKMGVKWNETFHGSQSHTEA